MAFSAGFNEQAYAQLSDSDKAELERLLRGANEAIGLNPLNDYVPHVKQKAFHSATTRTRAFVAGNRVGKSHAGVADDLIQLLSEDMLPDWLRGYKKWSPPCFIRVITPDLGFTMEAVLEKYRELTPKFALKSGSWDKGFDKTKRILRFENGSQVDFMSTEQDRDKFGGVKRHRIHYDEEPGGPNGEAIYKESGMRLIDFNGDEIWTFTPLLGMSWVYDQIWEPRHVREDLTVIQGDMDDNPHLSVEGKDAALRGYTDEERRVRKSGEFVALEGLFYPEFSDDLIKPSPPPEHFQGHSIVVGIDPGLTRTGVIWVAFDNDNSAFAFAELYPKDLVVADVASLIQETNKRWGIAPDYYVIDPSARNRSTVNAEAVEAEFARLGIYCQHGQNDRMAGILEVKGRLQHDGLIVSEDCKNLIWEFGRYRKNPNAQNEFDAIKVNDHLLDALRYVAMSRTWNFSEPPPPRRQGNPDPNFEPPWRGPSKPNHSAPQGAFPT